MKKKIKVTGSRKVVRATRSAVVDISERMQILAQKVTKLAEMAERTWEGSKPGQQKAKAELKKAAQEAVSFAKDVRKGLKEGLAEIQKRNKKR